MYINLLSLTGLEPAISRLEVWHVIQLRHRDNDNNLNVIIILLCVCL